MQPILRPRTRWSPLCAAMLFAIATPLHAQTGALTSDAFANLELRGIGPANMSGRIVDLAVVEQDPYVFYVAAATGGVWKTTNNGVTWTPVFEDQATHSVGDIAVHQRDTSIVWVGTGERASRQSNSWGDGVYKSTDGGRTWRNMGLRESRHIGRIALHPTDPQIVFVAAMGHLWGPNEERGLYKSTDGGASWRRVLYVDSVTGVVDVAIDPSDPGIMYAASYQRMRKPFGFHGGGPGSALWQSEDAGETWSRLGPLEAGSPPDEAARAGGPSAADTIGAASANGLPKGEYGRIGISIYRSDPRIVIVSIEQGYRYNASTAYVERRAGVYRSEDRGETWTHMSDWNPRPMYASQPLIDPSDDQRVYMMNAFSYSDDGGRTFDSPDQSLHGDDRILWVDPDDSRHLIKGDDGGVGISYDRGVTWLFITSLPLSQWYRVAVDDDVPFNVYGGLQDNGSWVGPSATYRSEGILNEDWRRTGGGDGFLSLPDTVDDRTMFSESQYLGLTRLDRTTWQRQDVRPGDPHGAIDARRNFDAWFDGTPQPDLLNAMAPANWDGPFVISPHDHNTIYAGTNQLWVSRDHGSSWTSLGDLTTGTDRRELRIMGERPHDYTPSIDDGAPYWPTITAIAESPLERGLLYAGTDDGQLQLSRDGGRSWTEVSGRIDGLPDDAWVNGIEASRHVAGTVYVVFNNYRNDDYANYLYRSTDRGETWTSLTGDLPADRVLRTVREDPRNPDVLWLGTELGLFVTNDGGSHWVELRANMPTMAFNDLVVHERDNDLVLATHNRGIWILDNVNAIQELTPAVVASDAQLFTIEPAALIRYSNDKAHTGDMVFAGENPRNGALIDYWLRTAQDSGDVAITVHDAQGARIASIRPARSAGINRVVWDLRHDRLPAPPGDDDDDGPTGVPVVPGVYTVRLAVAGRTFEQAVEVRDDPRLDVAPAARAAWTETLLRIADLYRDAIDVARTLHPLAQRLPGREDEAGTPLGAEAEREVAAIAELMDELVSRIDGVYSAVQDWTGPPTADQRSRIDYYAEQLAALRPRVESAVARHAR